ncbi:MAG: peptidoglycan-binding protein [Candidatus Omnitrophica bacterium]|nr:peptidoglycan-binding protein [Candidatus Omnitrophota bacterium]
MRSSISLRGPNQDLKRKPFCLWCLFPWFAPLRYSPTQTKEAIKAFQKANGFKIDGAVGAPALAELNKYLKD